MWNWWLFRESGAGMPHELFGVMIAFGVVGGFLLLALSGEWNAKAQNRQCSCDHS